MRACTTLHGWCLWRKHRSLLESLGAPVRVDCRSGSGLTPTTLNTVKMPGVLEDSLSDTAG